MSRRNKHKKHKNRRKHNKQITHAIKAIVGFVRPRFGVRFTLLETTYTVRYDHSRNRVISFLHREDTEGSDPHPLSYEDKTFRGALMHVMEDAQWNRKWALGEVGSFD